MRYEDAKIIAQKARDPNRPKAQYFSDIPPCSCGHAECNGDGMIVCPRCECDEFHLYNIRLGGELILTCAECGAMDPYHVVVNPAHVVKQN